MESPWSEAAGFTRRRAVLSAIAVAATGSLAFLAVDSGMDGPGSQTWLIVADLVVGIAFLMCGALAPGAPLMRGLISGVGALWLLGSWLPSTSLFHQGMLVAALTAFPYGRVFGRVRWLLWGLAVPVGLGIVPQGGVGILFGAVALVSVQTETHRRTARYAVLSAAGLAILLAGSWAYSRFDPAGFDPLLALLVYQILLVAIAIGFLFATRFLMASDHKLTDLVLSDEGLAGLEGLTSVLAAALKDPEIRVHRWHGGEIGHRVDSLVEPREHNKHQRLLEVLLNNEPIAAVSYNSPVLEDPSTREAVSNAVRLAVQHQELQERLQTELLNLVAARARLLAAVDSQRQATATQLREDVVTILRRARAELQVIGEDVNGLRAAEPLGLAYQELARAEDEVEALVAGVPPVLLGDGRLAGVLQELGKRSPIPVTVTASPNSATDAETEAALFYVGSEALTNAVKHSGADKVQIAIKGDRNTVGLQISDNGTGGADPSGFGLQGLSDRLAALGGRLQVESPPGAGTTVTATLPR